jgi:hypothetical protein
VSQSPHPLVDPAWIRQTCNASEMSIADCLREQDRVGPNILFDVDYYRSTYGADMPAGMTCLEHFCRQGSERPRNPNQLFSTQQWHETIAWHLPDPATWRRVLLTTMGAEARFSREELGRQDRREVIVSDTVTGAPPAAGQEICLFVHFDKHDTVQDYVVDYIDALRAEGVCVVFLTNSRKLQAPAQARMVGRAWRTVCCDNRSYDWGLYAVGVRLLGDLGIAGHPLILANDSVVGTMNSLSPLFAAARSGRHDITGAVDSLLHDWHLQSFFIYVSAEATASAAWKGFWRVYRPHLDRWYVINSQEMGFSRWMGRHSMRIGAAWEYDALLGNADNAGGSEWRNKVIADRLVANPTIELWDVLLKADFPFLKKSLFITPLKAGNVTDICNVLSARATAQGGAAPETANAMRHWNSAQR